ncbi:6662_t:CDS:2 [Ambispora gerdemannii]|uniref:6662_t:CDS:1 n=1 Tax=Ambispora gerdemannii TaxID=144530 RepID=A0A9N9H9Z7_9GLOM|nr:6662_t:CDS:2 [Ambispora gerdemannii]
MSILHYFRSKLSTLRNSTSHLLPIYTTSSSIISNTKIILRKPTTPRVLKTNNNIFVSFLSTTAKNDTERPFLLPKDVESYSESYTTPPNPYQESLSKKTKLAFPKEAHKMVPHLEATFLTFLARATRAKSILEIGCYTGYSTVALANGIRHRKHKGAKLTALDNDPVAVSLAKKHVELAGLSGIVEFKVGDAFDIIENYGSDLQFDMIFLDANKSGYLDYYNAIMDQDLLSKNGFIVADNVLFRGYVRAFSDPYVRFSDLYTKDGPVPPQHKNIARYMHRFNEAVQKDTRTDNVLLPIFDGLMLIWKRKSTPFDVVRAEKFLEERSELYR